MFLVYVANFPAHDKGGHEPQPLLLHIVARFLIT